MSRRGPIYTLIAYTNDRKENQIQVLGSYLRSAAGLAALAEYGPVSNLRQLPGGGAVGGLAGPYNAIISNVIAFVGDYEEILRGGSETAVYALVQNTIQL